MNFLKKNEKWNFFFQKCLKWLFWKLSFTVFVFSTSYTFRLLHENKILFVSKLCKDLKFIYCGLIRRIYGKLNDTWNILFNLVKRCLIMHFCMLLFLFIKTHFILNLWMPLQRNEIFMLFSNTFKYIFK